jgi:signal transduction histidine kinase
LITLETLVVTDRHRSQKSASMNRHVTAPIFPPISWARVFGSLLLISTVAAHAAEGGVEVVKNSGTTESVSVADQLGIGAWIWTSNKTDKQTCRLWRSFAVPKDTPLARATLRITADNGYRIFFDGREIGRGGDWKYLTEYDLTSLMSPGQHVLAIEAFNDAWDAGVILGLRLQFADGQAIEIFSDPSWRVVVGDDSHWQTRKHPGESWIPAQIVGFAGHQPWWQHPFKTIYAPPSLPLLLHFWQQTWFLVLLLAVCTMVVVVCFRQTTLLAVQTRAQKLLERERVRIARDIHDDLGARLTQLVLLGEVARSELPAGSELRTQIDQVVDKARDLSHAMDEVIWAVNSRRDTLRDFASYMCKYAQLFLAPTPIRCRLDVEPEIPATTFDLPIRRNLFLAVKEALNNTAKHSESKEVFLRIHRREHELVVTVEDDGKGFDPVRTDLERNGMTNMSQRMSEAGGRYGVTSAPGKGCRVEFTVPLSRSARFSSWFKRRRAVRSDGAARFENAPPVAATRAPDSARS